MADFLTTMPVYVIGSGLNANLNVSQPAISKWQAAMEISISRNQQSQNRGLVPQIASCVRIFSA